MIRPVVLFVAARLVCGAAGPARVEYQPVAPQLIQQRLEMVPQSLAKRRDALLSLFREVGCEPAEQKVPHSKAGNLICTMPGATPSAIVVGGHFDYIDRGTGAIDDWSGAVLLPSLYQSLKDVPRRHTYIFVAFAAEEEGLVGSNEYVKKLSPEQKSSIHAMINLECLGTSAPKVWATRADKRLLGAYIQIARALQIEPAASNVDEVGMDDSFPFTGAKIPVLTIHSVTSASWPLLHSRRDTLMAIHAGDYFASYKLAAELLALLDSTVE